MTITNFGTISGGIGIKFFNASNRTAAAQTIIDAGTIIGTAGTAIAFDAGNDLLKLYPGAVLTGIADGGGGSNTLELASAASAGTISGLGTSFQNFGSILVDSGAQWTIIGTNSLASGVTLNDQGILTNAGTITGAGKLVVDPTTFTNSGYSSVQVELDSGSALVNTNTGTIKVAGTAVYGYGGPVGVVNAGTIEGTGTAGIGAYLHNGGSLANNSTAAYIGGLGSANSYGVKFEMGAGTVTNYGTIAGGRYGIFLLEGGSVANIGTASLISSSNTGVTGDLATTTLSNAGTISGTTGAGVEFVTGGSLSNSGLIKGGAVGVFIYHGNSTVVNSGTISGSGGNGVFIAGGTVIDAGKIVGGNAVAIAFGTDGTGGNLLVLEHGYSITGAITSLATTSNTVELLGTSAANEVTATYNNLNLTNFGTIAFSSGPNNYAALRITDNATLPHTITNFTGLHDTIDLTALAYVSGSNSTHFDSASHKLAVTNGTSSVALQLGAGSYNGTSWKVANDGSGGTDVVVGAQSPQVTASLASDTGASSTDKVTSNSALIGGGDSDATVTITEGVATLGTTTADGLGHWSFSPSGLAEGTQTLVASETNLGGTGTATLTFTLDTTAPAISVTSTGTITNQATQTIAGALNDANLAASPTISLFDNGNPIATTTASGGNWSVSITLSGDGGHSITAQASDLAGNTGTSNSDALTLDTTAPSVTIGSGGGLTNQPGQTVSGTVSDANLATNPMIALFDNGAQIGTTTASGGAWSTSITLSGDGGHNVTAQASDLAGNTGTSNSDALTLDTTAPSVAITSSGTITNQPGQTVSGTVSDANLAASPTIILFDNGTQIGTATASGGNWSTAITLSGDGGHSVTAQATDLAGNTGASNTDALTLDTTAPAVSITSSGTITNQPAQTVSGTVSDANLAASPTITLFDNGTQIGTTTASGGNWSAAITLPSQGGNDITAQASDLAGNTGTSSAVALTLDTVVPVVTEALVADTGVSGTDAITANPAVTGSADPDATVVVSEGNRTLGQTTANGAGVWVFAPVGLADGPHTLVASETDGAGDTGTASLAFTLKTSAPAPYGLSLSPAALANTTTVLTPVIIGFGEPGDTLTLLDQTGGQGTTTVAADGTWSFMTQRLGTSPYTFTATESDIAGNLSAPSAPLGVTLATPDFKQMGDFDGDRIADLLFQQQDGTQQDGTLMVDDIANNQVVASTLPGQVGREWQLEGARDFNGDGTDDLLYRRGDGALQIDQFTDSRVTAVDMIGQVGNEWGLIGFGDFNGDGTADLLWQRSYDHMLMVNDVQNNVLTSTVFVGPIGPEWQLVGTDDFNADGTTDLLWQRTTDQMLRIDDMQNNQDSAQVEIGQVGREWQVIGTGDFSSPHTPGILFERGDGALMVDDVVNNQVTSSAIIGQLAAGWSLFGIGDTDGDGISDLVVRNAAGVTAVDHIANGQITATITLGPVGPEWTLFS